MKQRVDSVLQQLSAELLQGEFDTAEANHKRDLTMGAGDLAKVDTSYMEAADARMGDLGCTR